MIWILILNHFFVVWFWFWFQITSQVIFPNTAFYIRRWHMMITWWFVPGGVCTNGGSIRCGCGSWVAAASHLARVFYVVRCRSTSRRHWAQTGQQRQDRHQRRMNNSVHEELCWHMALVSYPYFHMWGRTVGVLDILFCWIPGHVNIPSQREGRHCGSFLAHYKYKTSSLWSRTACFLTNFLYLEDTTLHVAYVSG